MKKWILLLAVLWLTQSCKKKSGGEDTPHYAIEVQYGDKEMKFEDFMLLKNGPLYALRSPANADVLLMIVVDEEEVVIGSEVNDPERAAVVMAVDANGTELFSVESCENYVGVVEELSENPLHMKGRFEFDYIDDNNQRIHVKGKFDATAE